MQVIYHVAEEIIREKESTQVLTRKNIASWSVQDYISYIVDGSHPLYPVQSYEVKAMWELYGALADRPRDGRQKEIKEGNTTKIDLDYFRNLYISSSLRSIKYSISDKEKVLLKRIYDLLPEYHARNVTWALSEKTKDQKLPIHKDMQNAIDRIQQDVLWEEKNRAINLKYFRKLYWKSMKAKRH